MNFNPLLVRENELSEIVVNISYNLHVRYGPGLFESVYEELMCYELRKKGLKILQQHPIPLVHEAVKLAAGFRADIIVERKLLIEVKSVDCLAPIHFKQVQTYLKLSGLNLGLLINYNEVFLKDGMKRIINT